VSKSVVVVGGGIGGIATAGLLARDGYQVTLVEAHARLGGRAGLWEKDGFRFDTGPSWYLMPEVFDHWYKLMGTSADEHLTLTKLDPGYRVYFEPQGGQKAEIIDVRASREDNLALLEEIEPGSRATMEKYLDSAKETYEIAKEYFLYTSFQSLRTLLVPAVPPADDAHHDVREASHEESQDSATLGIPRGVLGFLPLHCPQHVPLDVLPRPRRWGALRRGWVHSSD
jgi:phytoene desaturase